jgi:hypothetical protein
MNALNHRKGLDIALVTVGRRHAHRDQQPVALSSERAPALGTRKSKAFQRRLIEVFDQANR